MKYYRWLPAYDAIITHDVYGFKTTEHVYHIHAYKMLNCYVTWFYKTHLTVRNFYYVKNGELKQLTINIEI